MAPSNFSFVHYAHTGQDCELRASRLEGDAYIQTLMIESKNQRLMREEGKIRVPLKIVKETEKALKSFFKRKERLPKAFTKLSKEMVKETIRFILETDFCKKLMSKYYILGSDYIKPSSEWGIRNPIRLCGGVVHMYIALDF